MLGSRAELQALQNTASLTWRECLIQSGRRMRIEVVLDEPDVFYVWIDLIDQEADNLSVILHRALCGHLDMPPPRAGFYHHKQIARAFAFIFIIDALRLGWLNRDGRVDIGIQDDRFLIQADRWVLWIIGLLIQIQYLFHSGDKLASYRGQAPVFMLPWLEIIF
jgi:hypothetical protein